MKTKVIEIVIVMVVLLLLAACFGCKDKAEAIDFEASEDFEIVPTEDFVDSTEPIDMMFTYHNEKLTLNIIDNEIVSSRLAEKAIEIIFKSLYVGYDIGPKSDVNNLSVRFPEPNEPRPEIRYDNGRSVSEPNEIFISETIGDSIDIVFNPAVYGDVKVIKMPEPNEPVISNYDYDAARTIYLLAQKVQNEIEKELNEQIKYSLPIPTWPDYIELEKELVIVWPMEKIEGGVWDYQPQITMVKGTKIYFKED